MTWLLDGNVLAAVSMSGHPHHQKASAWLHALSGRFATCSVTQGTLLRLHMCLAADTSAAAAWKALEGIEAHPLHDYWDDDLPYRDVDTAGLSGHRQVTMPGSQNSPVAAAPNSPPWIRAWQLRRVMWPS